MGKRKHTRSKRKTNTKKERSNPTEENDYLPNTECTYFDRTCTDAICIIASLLGKKDLLSLALVNRTCLSKLKITMTNRKEEFETREYTAFIDLMEKTISFCELRSCSRILLYPPTKDKCVSFFKTQYFSRPFDSFDFRGNRIVEDTGGLDSYPPLSDRQYILLYISKEDFLEIRRKYPLLVIYNEILKYCVYDEFEWILCEPNLLEEECNIKLERFITSEKFKEFTETISTSNLPYDQIRRVHKDDFSREFTENIIYQMVNFEGATLEDYYFHKDTMDLARKRILESLPMVMKRTISIDGKPFNPEEYKPYMTNEKEWERFKREYIPEWIKKKGELAKKFGMFSK
jgi:hypothetical protein